MGYAKKPGSFWDSVGVVIVIAFTAELLFLVVSLWAGTPEMFKEFNVMVWNGLKEFFLEGTGFVMLAAAAVLFVIVCTWKGDPHEE